MKIKYIQLAFTVIIVLSIFTSLLLGDVLRARAQSSRIWSDPINLSKSGSSTSPLMVVDSKGMFHVIWIDQFDGYKYVESLDGINWSFPKTVKYPFSPKDDALPVFIPDDKEGIHIFWRDNNALFYAKSTSSSLGEPSKWAGNVRLADSVIDFNVVIDALGVLHMGYVTNHGGDTAPAGIYYQKLKGSSWSVAQNIYSSQYFRSLKPDDANVRLAVSNLGDQKKVFIVWDDRAQKRIFLSKSSDGGDTWEGLTQISGPESSAGLEMPYQVTVGYANGKILLLWKFGLPGQSCTQYGQVSLDEGMQFEAPVKLLEESVLCPQRNEFVIQNSDISMVSLYTQNDLSLIAWNGSHWSEPQPQNEISTFSNPATFDNILFGCQNMSYHENKLYLVGCDEGTGGDIWFTSRTLGSVDDWFPSPSAWSVPVVLENAGQKISTLSSVADGNNNIHLFWSQSSFSEDSKDRPTIQYSRWDGKNRSTPTSVISGLSGEPIQLTVNADGLGRLLLAWVDGKTGEILFSWASTDHASRASEWAPPQYLPSATQGNSSPDILVDDSGMILVTYAVPINEQRGIYFVASSDAGNTWSQPLPVFEAAPADWDMVDQPKICLTGDGRLHVLFARYSLLGDQRQSQGLYYSQSTNGGLTWSEPEMVNEQSVLWSRLICYDKQIIHRLWQEKKQSTIFSFHQVSRDAGLNWSRPTTLSSISGGTDLTTMTMDRIGNLYFIQIPGVDNPNIQIQKWDGSGWISQESKEINLKNPGIPSSIAASVASEGYLLASVLVNYPDQADGIKSGIVYLGRHLISQANIQPSSPVLIPTPEAMVAKSEMPSDALQTPTSLSPLSGLKDNSSPSFSKNLIGILLVVGLFILIVVTMRLSPRPKK